MTLRPFRIRASLLLGLLSALGTAPAPAAADTPASSPIESALTLRGFGTVGVARSSSDQVEFVRDLSQPDGITDHWSGRIDSVLGLQANWQASPAVELIGQVVSRYRYDRSRSPELMWAFARWQPDARVALRAGRIGADFMMLADSRLVGYSYLPVRPSSDFFGPLFFPHFDGLDASVTLPLGKGLLHGKLFGGATQEKVSGTHGIWDTSGSPVQGAVLDYQSGAWQWYANATSIRFSSDINFSPLPQMLRAAGAAFPAAQDAADALRTRDTRSRFYSVGAVYDEGPLLLQGMLNKINHQTGALQNSHAGYLLAGYRLGPVTPYAGVSWWKSRAKPLSSGLPAGAPFDALNQGFAQLMHASAVDQKTYTLGARWDALDKVAFKVQWDAIRGAAGASFPYQHSTAGWNGRADIVSLTLDFVF